MPVSHGKIRCMLFFRSIIIRYIGRCFVCHLQENQVSINGDRDHERTEQRCHQAAAGKWTSDQGKDQGGSVHGSHKHQSDDGGDSFFVHIPIPLSVECFQFSTTNYFNYKV